MYTRTSVARGTVITGICLALAAAARAEPPLIKVYVESISTPAVRVVSTDNVKYDALVGNTYAYSMQVYGDCGSDDFDILVVQGNTPTNPAPPAATLDVSDLVHPTRWLTSHFYKQPDTALPITWPLSMRQKVVAACNDNLASKLAAGMTRAAVLSQSWKLGKVAVGDVQAGLYCVHVGQTLGQDSYGTGASRPAYATVTCDPRGPSDNPRPVPGDRTGNASDEAAVSPSSAAR